MTDLSSSTIADAPTPDALTPEYVAAAIAESDPLAPKRDRDTVRRILGTTSNLFETEPDVLLGGSRAKNICDARHVAIALIRANTSLSWPEIGRMFNNRDQATVINAVRTVLEAPMRRSWAAAVMEAMNEEETP